MVYERDYGIGMMNKATCFQKVYMSKVKEWVFGIDTIKVER
tara:strand:- start:20 stop:142 length:123 start_codon:yes stop_codon:yes gene_type:complete